MKKFIGQLNLFLLSSCLLILLVLHLHNLVYFPVTRGFDATAHIDYINLIKNQHRLPMPDEGWELYQPPLFYLIGSGLPNLKIVQFFGIGMWLVLIVASYYFSKQFYDHFFALLGAVLLGSVPVVIYMTLSIGNEFTANVLIMILLMVYLGFKNKSSVLTYGQVLIIGIIGGLALITKATALVAVGMITLDLILSQKFFNKSALMNAAVFVSVLVILAGWFYLRNLIFYHNPLIATDDFIPLSSFAQVIVPRTWVFLTDLTSFWQLDLFKSADHSLIGGTYFSFFFDSKNVLAPVQEFSKAGMILVTLSYPLALLSLIGMQKLWQNRDPIGRFLIGYAVLLLLAYVLYNFRIPLSSSVKGSFILSLALPYVFFVLAGFSRMPTLIKAVGPVYMLVYILVILRNFWILPWWTMV